jgi:lysozyme
VTAAAIRQRNQAALIGLLSGDLPPVVDIEVLSSNSLPDLATEVVRFLNLLEKQYGTKLIIYSGKNFANEYLKGFANYPLWLAEYNNDQAPQLPLDWTAWTFWQYSQGGSVAGVAGQVDLDRFNGDRDRFQALLIPQATPPTSTQ